MAVKPVMRSILTGGDTSSVPTLFRIPQIGGASTSETSVQQESLPAVTGNDFAAPEEQQKPEPESFHEPEISRYDSLPELPPLDEPAGRSWMETMGSRVVLALLLLAVASVAIMASRDVPQITGSTPLAEDMSQQADAGLVVLDPPDVSLGQHDSESFGVEPSLSAPENILPEIPVGDDRPEPNVLTKTTEHADTGLQLDLGQGHMENDLPAIDPIEEDPTELMPALPPLPDVAFEEPTPLDENAAADETPEEQPVSVDEVASADLIIGNGEVKANPLVDEKAVGTDAGLAAHQDKWQRTSTPMPVGDWLRYLDKQAEQVSFSAPQQPAGVTEPIPSQPVLGNQFPYPQQPQVQNPRHPVNAAPYLAPAPEMQGFHTQGMPQNGGVVHYPQNPNAIPMQGRPIAPQTQLQMPMRQQPIEYVPGRGYAPPQAANVQPQQPSGQWNGYVPPANQYGQPRAVGYPVQPVGQQPAGSQPPLNYNAPAVGSF